MTIKTKLLAVIETGLVFAFVTAGFNGLRLVHPLRAWEEAVPGGWPWVSYAFLLVFTPAFLAITRRPFIHYGLVWLPVRYHMSIFSAAFLPVFLLSVALAWIDWHQWPGALLVSFLTAVLLILTAWLLRGKPAAPGISSWSGGLAPLILVPLVQGQVLNPLFSLVGAYLLVGPAEEMFFRGYAQSRLNLAFGRPFCKMGISWGWGMLISAGLFGLWHAAMNPLAPSAWLQALWTFIAGLIFSIMREKSGSVFAPALLHGVLNYGPQALLFDLFF
jgi:membrane protease YdiL (CAAX protease family)